MFFSIFEILKTLIFFKFLGNEYYFLPNTGAYDQSHCNVQLKNDAYSLGPGHTICPYDDGKFKPHRFAFNEAAPLFIVGRTALTPFFRAGPILYNKFENIWCFWSRNLYSLCSSGNQDYNKILYF